MSNREVAVCREYVNDISERAIRPLPPLYFEPDWVDQPSRFKIYRAVQRIPLPHDYPDQLASLLDLVSYLRQPPREAKELTLPELSLMLQFAHGVLSRRLKVTWNQDDRDLAAYHLSGHVYARGTPSGGGMYPTEIYLASGTGAHLSPGLYHYDGAHHALECLLAGDISSQIRASVFEHAAAQTTDQFLLISLNFWKNAFKYNSFCYHTVTQDIGALLCSLRLLAIGCESDLQPIFWHHDAALNQLLGLETLDESVAVVIPLPRTSDSAAARADTTVQDKKRLPSVHRTSFQRSKRVVRFERNTIVHQSTLIEAEPRPAYEMAYQVELHEAGQQNVVLPPPALELLQKDLLQTFVARRSSFGCFSSQVPLSMRELGTLLYFAASVRRYSSDIKPASDPPAFTRLGVFITNVEGVEPGVYSYSAASHALLTISTGDMKRELQKNYFLQNYNLAQTGAVLALIACPEKMFELYGNRGYRIMNAEVGMVAQGIYLAATALEFGCGAALGFSNVAMNALLGLQDSDEKTLLFLLLGHERPESANFDCRLV